MVILRNRALLDKLNGDKWVDIYSDVLGVDPELIVPDDQVAQIRQQRAQAQQAAMKTQMQNQQADTIGKLAQVPTQGGDSNAASDVIGMFSGYNTPQ